MADCKETQEQSNGPESLSNNEMEEPEKPSDVSVDEKTSSSVLAVPKLGNPLVMSEPPQSNSNVKQSKFSFIRPPQLNVANKSPAKQVLQPSKLQNPFMKVSNDEKEKVETKPESNSSSNREASDKPKFLPLVSSTKDNKETIVNNHPAPSKGFNVSTPSFVFGQNLKERIVSQKMDGTESKEVPASEATEENDHESKNKNGSSELLFSNAAATVCRPTDPPALTLNQAAQRLEEAAQAKKRKYDEVQFLTGEEGEKNVLQIDCKFYTFNKVASSYQDKGRGTLRLNDCDEDESRLVGRTKGTQRVVLNTKVWSGMTVQRASDKSLRFTAMDANGDIRVFLVQAMPKEMDLLLGLLVERLERAQERQPKKVDRKSPVTLDPESSST